MREILFRGKRIDTGEWVYGFYGHKPNGNGVEEHFIMEWFLHTTSDSIYTYFQDVPVIPETIGQYTGYKDMDGKRIFRGDVLVFDGDRFVVLWNEERGGFQIDYWQFDERYDFSELWPTSEVIGNVYDNPELMEEIE